MTWHLTLRVPVTFGKAGAGKITKLLPSESSTTIYRQQTWRATHFHTHIWREGDQGSWGETWDSKVTASRWAHLNPCVTVVWVTDRPANHNVEHHSEEDDGHSGGDSDQHYLTVLTGDGKGWEIEREREKGRLLCTHWTDNVAFQGLSLLLNVN